MRAVLKRRRLASPRTLNGFLDRQFPRVIEIQIRYFSRQPLRIGKARTGVLGGAAGDLSQAACTVSRMACGCQSEVAAEPLRWPNYSVTPRLQLR
jgi:hypothetical protein